MRPAKVHVQVCKRQRVPICHLSSAARQLAPGCQLWDHPTALYAHSFVPRSPQWCISTTFSMIADGCGRARSHVNVYRGPSLIRNSTPLGPYSRNMPRALWWS